MNILVIPSWYPTSNLPLRGIFTKEQCDFYSLKFGCDKIAIANWLDDYSPLPLKDPILSLSRLMDYFKSDSKKKISPSGMIEYFEPAITWSQKIPCSTYFILNSCKKAINKFEAEYGKIDIIHAHVSFPAGYVAYLIYRELGIPYVITEHMGPFPFPSMLKRDGRVIDEISKANKYADRVIAVSNHTCTEMKRQGLNCTDVIHNSVDASFFYNKSKSKSKSNHDFVFCSLGEHIPIKGFDVLIEAISLLPKDYSSKFKFVIAGDGPLRKEYIQLSKNKSIENIFFPGRLSRSEVADLLSESHVFISPSRYESFGIVCIEALLSGIPVIATKCGGPEDIVNVDNGLIIDVDSPQLLKEAIINIFDNYYLYSSDAIKKDAIDRFSAMNRMCDIRNVYIDVISENIDG